MQFTAVCSVIVVQLKAVTFLYRFLLGAPMQSTLLACTTTL